MSADRGHLEIKRRRIAELEAENETLRLRVRTLEADLLELGARLGNAQRPAPAAPGIVLVTVYAPTAVPPPAEPVTCMTGTSHGTLRIDVAGITG